MSDRNHWNLLTDGVVRVRVGRLARGRVCGGVADRQRAGDLRVARSKGTRAAWSEVVVEEVRDFRIVGAPAEQEQAVEQACVGVVDERRRLLLLQRGRDANVSQLLLQVLCELRCIGLIRPGHVAVLDLRLQSHPGIRPAKAGPWPCRH